MSERCRGFEWIAAEVKEKITTQGMFVVANSTDEFTPFLRAEYDKWGKVIRDAKMKVQ